MSLGREIGISVSPLDIGLLAAAHAQEGSLSRAEECIERLHQLAARQYITPLAEGFAAIGMRDVEFSEGNNGSSFLNENGPRVCVSLKCRSGVANPKPDK